MEKSPVIQDGSPNSLPLQCILKENDSPNVQWQTLGEKLSTSSNSRLLFLTVEYIQDNRTNDMEFNNYPQNISENERISPFDRNLNSPDRYSPLYNTLVIPSDEQLDFPSSVVVLPKTDSQQISIVVEQSQVRREVVIEEKNNIQNGEEFKMVGGSREVSNDQHNSFVTQSNEGLCQKLIITGSPGIVLSPGPHTESIGKKSQFLTCDGTYFQGEAHKIASAADFAAQPEGALQTDFTSPSSHETTLLNEAEDVRNKTFIGSSKFVLNGGEALKQDELLLSDSDQNHDLLIKSEALMEVDSYNLTPEAYNSSEDRTPYPIMEEQLDMNHIEKTEHDFLLPDAMAFEATDLQSNLEVFTSNVLESNGLLFCDKARLRQNRKHLGENLDFDYWCEDCEFGMKCSRHNVKIVNDKPVPSRARATLPKELLTINKVHENSNEEGVFARKTIMRRVQFGPVEGNLLKDWKKATNEDEVELILEVEPGNLRKMDVSDENDSNWMRFVRKAKTLKEQNLILTQQEKSLYFTTTRLIPPRHELRVGYSPQYAEKRKLTILDNPSWQSFGFSSKCSSPDENEEDQEKEPMEPKNLSLRGILSGFVRSKTGRGSKHADKTSDADKKENECLSCHKTFPKTHSLKRHLLSVHSEKNKENSGVVKSFKEKTEKLPVANTLFKKKHSSGSGSEWLCTHCNLTFDNPSVLNLHTLTHAAEDLESEAVLGLSSELSAVYHEGEFLVENGDVQCPQCTQEFPSKRQLIDHVSTHGKITSKKCCPNVAKPYKCDQCYKAFATDVRLQKHMLVHGAEEAKPYQCDICFKRFLNNSALSCHRKIHNDNKVFECPLCKKQFEQVFGLKEHVKIHSADGFFTCPHCSKVFEGYSMVRKHVRAFHSGLQHICKDCGKLCATLDKLRMHSLKHSDHREFLCANCGKQFKRKDKLKEHMKRMHSAEREMKLMSLALRIPNTKGRRFTPKMSPLAYDRFIYKCRNCMVGFKRRGMLVNHLAKRHPDIVPDTVPELNLPILKTTRDYFCQYCDKIYKSSSKRKAHILKNHPGAELPMSNRQKGGVPQLPGIPNPTFSKTVGSVKTAPHGCKWCHKQYASKAKLLQHQRKKHVSLLPKAQQVPRVSKNPGAPGGNQPKENPETDYEKWKKNKEREEEIESGKSGEQIDGVQNFAVGEDFVQDLEGAYKKTTKPLQENISCELLNQAMNELSQSLSEYKLPFAGAQESLLKIMGLKEGEGGQILRTWPDLPPYPPR